MNSVRRPAESADETPTPKPGREPLESYPLLKALKERRSRRFCAGMEMPSGPLAFRSRFAPQPLALEEEALLSYSAVGITGHVLGDLSYSQGQGGNIMAGLVGRTIASGDGIQTVSCVVTNDSGTWFLKRPQDFSPQELKGLIELSQEGRYTELYERSRVQLSTTRSAPPKDPLFNIRVNDWSAYARGTTCIVPINDLTFMYINGLLEILSESTGAYIVDERNFFRPAGLAAFGRSRGGHLEDHPAQGKTVTIQQVETMVTEFVAIEQGMVAQNLGLMTQAMGLGGFPFFANHPFSWFEALGFTMKALPASRYLGVGGFTAWMMKLLGKESSVPLVTGLERNGETLLRAYSPPHFATMSEAVDAVVAAKQGSRGCFRQPNANPQWKESDRVTAQVAPLSAKAIAATKAYCEYVWNRYERFPVYLPPFRTIVAFQAGHLDLEFYDRYYRPEAVSESHRRDFKAWTEKK